MRKQTKAQTVELTVDLPEGRSTRLDKYLARALPDHSRSYLQKLIKDKQVRLNGAVCESTRQTVQAEDLLRIVLPEKPGPMLIGEHIDLPIVFEDDDIVVISKPPDMVVHPAAGNWTGTVVNALVGRDMTFGAEFSDSLRPGIVHRLDKDTSGCLIVAKHEVSLYKLGQAFRARKVEKTYAAICYGHPRLPSGEVKTLIGRHKTNRKKMAVVDRNGKEAHTRYRVLRRGMVDGVAVSLMEVEIFTGRTHQIRVHMSHQGFPVVGDTLYANHQKLAVPRQMLHAWKLAFPHPVSREKVSFECPFPQDFQDILDRMENPA